VAYGAADVLKKKGRHKRKGKDPLNWGLGASDSKLSWVSRRGRSEFYGGTPLSKKRGALPEANLERGGPCFLTGGTSTL